MSVGLQDGLVSPICHCEVMSREMPKNQPIRLNVSLEINFKKGLIGHFHYAVILLQLPEFISFSFSNSNFVIPVDSEEQ